MELYNSLLYLVGLYVVYSYEDISYNKSTSQSHSHTDKYYGAGHAVDRNTLTCTSTYNIGLNSSHKTVRLTVDLGGIFNIYGINIQFKDYEGYENRQRGRFAGFSLFVSKSGVLQGSTLCYQDGSQLPPLNFTATCSTYGRYVIYYNERLDIVTYPPGYELFAVSTEICEFIVQGCKSGVYGRNCDMPCPFNCAYNTCHIHLGTCYICKPGWTGTICNAKCREGWYGNNCSHQCVGHCRDGTFCNHVTGHCERGCDAGWTGFICEKQCIDGTYGYNCVNNCSGHCLNNTPCHRLVCATEDVTQDILMVTAAENAQMDNLEWIAEKAVAVTVLTTSHVTTSAEFVQVIVTMDTPGFIATIVTDFIYSY